MFFLDDDIVGWRIVSPSVGECKTFKLFVQYNVSNCEPYWRSLVLIFFQAQETYLFLAKVQISVLE